MQEKNMEHICPIGRSAVNVHVVIFCRLGDQASSHTISYHVKFLYTALDLLSKLLPFIKS